jgi:hypothetical protein
MGTPNSNPDKHVWRREDVISVDPQLANAFDLVTGKVQMLGLVNKVIDHRDNTFIYFELTSFGRICIDDLRGRVEHRAP